MSAERFAQEWLRLREPVDHRSRNGEVMQACSDWCEAKRPQKALDLAAGAGSNARYLAPRLPMIEEWLLVDHDADLLEQSRDQFQTKVANLANGVAKTLLDGVQLVTASALLDLVSHSWLEHLVERCRAQRIALLFAISVDGRIRFDPPLHNDPLIVASFAKDQTLEKGLGAPLGATAPKHMKQLLSDHGFATVSGAADWHLDAGDATLQRMFLDSYTQAARQSEPAAIEEINAWLETRHALIAAGDHKIEVGHTDIFASPVA